jgi:hypothetical protein
MKRIGKRLQSTGKKKRITTSFFGRRKQTTNNLIKRFKGVLL